METMNKGITNAVIYPHLRHSRNTIIIIHEMPVMVITPSETASLIATRRPYQPSKLSNELLRQETGLEINDASSFTFQAWHSERSRDVKMAPEPADEKIPSLEQISDKFGIATSKEDLRRAVFGKELYVKRESWDPMYE